MTDDRPSELVHDEERAETSTRRRRGAEARDRQDDVWQATRRSALEAGVARDHFYENHPVTRNEAEVATPPLQDAYATCEGVVVHRDPGTCLLGAFRIGKTTAITVIVRQLSKTFPKLPVGIAVAKHHDNFTQGTFFSDLLHDFDHAGALSGTAQQKRLRVFNMMLAQARQMGSDRYLLIVDEGQNWGELQWTWLRDFANDLHAKHIRLITLTFGQTTETQMLRQRLLSRGRTDLVGRFLLSPREFRGLRDEAELRTTLEAYDDPQQCEYPVGSGISYSEFYMPVSWRGGWRMAHEATAMWTEFKNVAARSNHAANNIGMNWIGGAIRNFLFSGMADDGVGFRGTPQSWAIAVQATGYESTLF